jgi:flavin-dependent thymidylate synthase
MTRPRDYENDAPLDDARTVLDLLGKRRGDNTTREINRVFRRSEEPPYVEVCYCHDFSDPTILRFEITDRVADELLAQGMVAGKPECRGRRTFVNKPGDEKLLKYLWDNKHATPFEMAGAVFEIQAPIIVFREWQRHRTQSYNEMSARYTPLPDVNYIPTIERLMINAGTSNKQAGAVKDAEALTADMAKCFQINLRNRYADAEEEYQRALRTGVPKELARLIIPVASTGYSKIWDEMVRLQERVLELEGGLVLPGWMCGACGVFNGEAKEKRMECRACGGKR